MTSLMVLNVSTDSLTPLPSRDGTNSLPLESGLAPNEYNVMELMPCGFQGQVRKSYRASAGLHVLRCSLLGPSCHAVWKPRPLRGHTEVLPMKAPSEVQGHSQHPPPDVQVGKTLRRFQLQPPSNCNQRRTLSKNHIADPVNSQNTER